MGVVEVLLPMRTWNGVFGEARAAGETRPRSMAVRIGAQIETAFILYVE